MHGSIKQMVCPDPDCKAVIDMDDELMGKLKRHEDVPCRRCAHPSIRCRIMLYDDKDGTSLHPQQTPPLHDCAHYIKYSKYDNRCFSS